MRNNVFNTRKIIVNLNDLNDSVSNSTILNLDDLSKEMMIKDNKAIVVIIIDGNLMSKKLSDMPKQSIRSMFDIFSLKDIILRTRPMIKITAIYVKYNKGSCTKPPLFIFLVDWYKNLSVEKNNVDL